MLQHGTIEPLQRRKRIPFHSCPLCRGAKFEPVKTASCTGHALYDPRLPAEIEWVRCDDCSHVFTSGYFDEAALKILHAKTQTSHEPGYDLENQRLVAAEMIDRVIAISGPNIGPVRAAGSWLDVGFGSGALFATAAEYGFKAAGLDLRVASVHAMRALGYDAVCAPLESVSPDQTFDVISMCDVVEHVPFPALLLNEARKRMSAGGLLLVSMPNTDSFAWRALDFAGANPYWGEIEHYHNFSRDRLERLLTETGFETLNYSVSRRYRACMQVIARAS